MGLVWDERTILDGAWISGFSFNKCPTYNRRGFVGIVNGSS